MVGICGLREDASLLPTRPFVVDDQLKLEISGAPAQSSRSRAAKNCALLCPKPKTPKCW